MRIKRLIFGDGPGFEEAGTDVCVGNMDMAPKTKNLAADLFFKTGNQGGRNDHHGNAQRYGHYGNAYDEPGEGLATGSGYFARYEEFCVQDFGFKIQDFGFRISDFGFPISDSRFRIPDFGFPISDSRFRIPDSGFRIPPDDKL